MALLIVFLLRLCLGLVVGMALVSHQQVSSGYYRNHLYVALGLATLAALLAPASMPAVFWFAVAAAVVCYVGATLWLYEQGGLGKASLWAVAGIALAGLMIANNLTTNATAASSTAHTLWIVQPITSSLLLGTTLAAMLLGHWYLNAPGMQLAPLRLLLIAMSIALVLHAVVCLCGLLGEIDARGALPSAWIMFLALRWTCLLGIAGLIVMTWQTLKIPNTQSATGILYVAVIGVFTGEIASLVLSAESLYPV